MSTVAEGLVHRVVARNYAEASENRMHSDETAARYGFRGGLVPGVAVYAYMTVPVVRALGMPWLERGAMKAKFLKPVYDGEEAAVSARFLAESPARIEVGVTNPEGVLCAVGEAFLHGELPPPNPHDYAAAPLPDRASRKPPEIAALPSGTALGALEFVLDLPNLQGEHGGLFVDNVLDPLPLYRGAEAVCHPAYWPAKANAILMANVALGPWIHTASEVTHWALPENGERVVLRGRVRESYEKRGHECVVLDLGLFGRGERPLARVLHSAIIRPALASRRA